ncbi:MAG: hypothetical protein G01um101425_957 [Candidatus Peregrinibacteria bacterium Gr01-1014_25]|nr:MAG: hypothetical protein G01um101425_957 [Candidatus Peregrinibacteria bacterium Gr01-1014_25]
MKRQLAMTDPDVQILASLSLGLKGEYIRPREDPWAGSPFAWILTRPSRQRGKIGEQLLAGWCAARDLNVLRSGNSDADRVIEGKRVEIKFSTLWQSGSYTFQQIRDQDYDYLICLGICPLDAHAWIFAKRAIPFGKLKHQHGGSRGRDTWWLTFKPDQPPVWLRKGGGRLADVHKILARFRTKNRS